MKGFSTGVMMALSAVTALVRSSELSTEAPTCRKMMEPYQMRTTVRCDEQVEKAGGRAYAEGVLTMATTMWA